MRKASTKPQASQPVAPNVPIHTIRHRSIKVSIWRNETEKGPVFNVMVVRGYLDGQQWKDSHSFSYDDLPIVAKLLCDAHGFITAYRAGLTKTPANAAPQKQDGRHDPAPNHERR